MPLSREEIADLWALDVAVEAEHVPDDELRRAVADGRVQEAFSTSSMGTAETYWRRVGPGEPLDAVRAASVVLPPGRQVEEVAFLDRLDDRDVVGCLWVPFHERRLDALASRLDDAARRRFADERARVARVLRARRGRDAWDAAQATALRLELVRLGVRLALRR